MVEKKNIWERYSSDLPEIPTAQIVTLGEGDTPLIPSRWLGSELGLSSLSFKAEYQNPTGSYKDRFAAGAVGLMRARGQTRCLATSSGNAGAALASYTAAAGLKCTICITEVTPESKLSQMLAHGAKILRINGFGTDQALTTQILNDLQQIAASSDMPLIISAYAFCPEAADGIMTIAFEMCEDAEKLPHHVFIPVGGGGSLSGVAKGFSKRMHQGVISRMPKIHAVQPELNDTLVTPLLEGEKSARSVDTFTKISGVAVPVDIDATLALGAVRNSGGSGFLVSDEEVWETQAMLIRHEGVFVEPAGALSVAGLIKAAEGGAVGGDEKVVCVLSGTGFKDAEALARIAGSQPVITVDPSELREALAHSQ